MALIKFLDGYFNDSNESLSLRIDLKKVYMFNKTHFADFEEKLANHIESGTPDGEVDLEPDAEAIKDTFLPAMVSLK